MSEISMQVHDDSPDQRTMDVERPGSILVRVAGLTRPKSGSDLGGLPRKMPRIQANLAAECVTRLSARLGLNPAQACIAAGLRTTANNCYDFYLTEDEAASPRTLDREKPVNGTLDHYRRIVEALAGMALESGRPVPVEDLLDELAEAVTDYLARFSPHLTHTDADEAAEALSALSVYLSRPRMGPGGREVDLPAYWRACRARGLSYDAGRNAMVEQDRSVFGADWPAVPLGWRWAAAARVSCTDLTGEPLAVVPAELVYHIRLAACPGKGGTVEMRFLLEAWTALPLGPGAVAAGRSVDADAIFHEPSLTVRGFPFETTRASERRMPFDMVIEGPVTVHPDLESWVRGERPAFPLGDATVPASAEGCSGVLGSGSPFPTDSTSLLDMPRNWAGHGDPVGGCATPKGLCGRLYRAGGGSFDAIILSRGETLVTALANHGDLDERETFLRRMRG